MNTLQENKLRLIGIFFLLGLFMITSPSLTGIYAGDEEDSGGDSGSKDNSGGEDKQESNDGDKEQESPQEDKQESKDEPKEDNEVEKAAQEDYEADKLTDSELPNNHAMSQSVPRRSNAGHVRGESVV
jgi:hypothetical protein